MAKLKWNAPPSEAEPMRLKMDTRHALSPTFFNVPLEQRLDAVDKALAKFKAMKGKPNAPKRMGKRIKALKQLREQLLKGSTGEPKRLRNSPIKITYTARNSSSS